MRLQVVGLPQRAHRRIEGEFRAWAAGLGPDVEIRPAPSLNETVPQVGVQERRLIEAHIQEGFAHIVAVPYRAIGELQTWFELDCRVTRLAIRDAVTVGWDDFRAALIKAISFEQQWCTALKPTDLNHALLLPPISFVPARDLQGFWRQCDCYNDARLNAASNLLERFGREHRKSQAGVGAFWLDTGGRRFIVDRARHARTAEERVGRRLFRFCYEVPHGFHYDVTHETNPRFNLITTERTHVGITRANVDSWGSVRAVHR